MFVNDVVPDADVHRQRNILAPGSGGKAEIAIGKRAVCNRFTDSFTKAKAIARRLLDYLIEFAGLAPHAEVTAPNVASHTFGGGAVASEFVIVDDACPVHGN